MEATRVVIADDSEIYMKGLRQLLEESGHIKVVAEAVNGRELLACVQETKPDVVVTDIQMPVMNGIETMRVLAREYGFEKVLALTMHSSEFLIVDMLEAGAMGYVDKSTSKEGLLLGIDTVHKGGHYHCPTTSMRLAKLIGASKAKLVKPPVAFTEQELAVIRLVCQGEPTKVIAPAIAVSESKVDKIKRELQWKLGVNSMAGVVMYAVRMEIV